MPQMRGETSPGTETLQTLRCAYPPTQKKHQKTPITLEMSFPWGTWHRLPKGSGQEGPLLPEVFPGGHRDNRWGAHLVIAPGR